MKKILAMTLALTMSAMMFASCGDSADGDSSKSETTTTTTAAAEDEAPEESEAEEEKADDQEPTAEEEAPAVDNSGWSPISGIADALENYDNASVKFEMDSDVTGLFEMFNEDKNGVFPGEEGYTGDEALLDFSIQEVAGIPMLKCDEVINYIAEDDANNGHKGLKIRLDMNKLFEAQPELMEDVFKIKVELVAIAREQAVYDNGLGPITVGWYGGAVGTNNNGAWNGNSGSYDMSSASGEGWCNQWSTCVASAMIGLVDSAKFSTEYETNYTTIMAWIVKSEIDLYIADIVFEDEDGNVIAIPEGAIPGGATYVQEENVDADSDGIIEYNDNGEVVLEG